MSTVSRISTGAVSVIDWGIEKPRPYEIRLDDVWPFVCKTVAVRAGKIAAAAEILTKLAEFERARICIGVNVSGAQVARRWRELSAVYRQEWAASEAGFEECRVEIDGQVLDPFGKWSARRPDRLPVCLPLPLGAAG